ncbi:hypothetical protein [Leucobacter iarius]|uniref:GNAT family N-acetyltransferase n=1 Tax=Leucobacter iarius TaxID=333963 RepID=A0ABP4XEM9_9MICO
MLHRLLYPVRLDADGAPITIRRAQADDIPTMVRLLATDQVASNRFEEAASASGPQASREAAEHPYLVGFTRILLDPGNELVVAENADFEVIAMMQLTLIPGFARRGASVLLLRGFRAGDEHSGLRAMLRWAQSEAAQKLGAGFVEAVVDATGTDARRTLETIGFTGTAVGYRSTVPRPGS